MTGRSTRVVAVLLSLMVAVTIASAGVEVWVRRTWDARQGTPGFYLADPVRGQRLTENYTGWFAGVPVHINSLGLRDAREYPLVKQPNTFRILVLGDSVTFGHGSVYENTYPYLIEQRLKAWRPDVDWQVWNAAVPGYNTSQELAQLHEVGPRFDPDLVIVGFYENDLLDNRAVPPPTRVKRAATAITAFARHHFWSLEFYRRVYYTAAWRITSPTAYHRRLETLARDDAAEPHDATQLAAQQLTPYDWFSDDLVASRACRVGCTSPDVIAGMQREPGFAPWLAAVRDFQSLQNEGRYRIVFFLNIVPRRSYEGDFFFDGSTRLVNQFLLQTLGDGTPAVSVHDAFLHARPSQMPNADGHALGNANVLKARVLFEYLRDRVLPDALPSALRARRSP